MRADTRFARFEELPSRFGFKGEVVAFARRRVVIWMTPIIYIGMIFLISALILTAPDNLRTGDPNWAIVLVSLGSLASHFFILWLIARWAAKQSSPKS